MFMMLGFFEGGRLGGGELLVILFIVLLLFGSTKLPQLARSLGKSLSEFKKGKEEGMAQTEKPKESGQTNGDQSESDRSGK
jgi:sec-independent protein translocase protein TatA